MKKTVKGTALVALSASVALLAAGCSGGTTSSTTASEGGSAAPVTMSFWHNSTTGDGKQYWEDTVAAFEKEHPNVTINIQAIQNEDMDGKLQTALASGGDPTIFMARGGGKLADVVAADQVMDITDQISPDIKTALGNGIFSAFTVDGKIYGMPTSVLPGGMYYSKDLFAKAGITATPTTFEELNAAVTKLKAAGIAPIALGGKDAWPAAHWYYFMALRDCSRDTMDKAAATKDFSDPCWLKAGEDLQAFTATDPFNKGYLTTSAQQGAGSSAGMIANHKAAMELMGAWDPGVIADLTPDKKALPDLGWFPFPAVTGGAGDPTAMMGGSDGFACRKDAPPACMDFHRQQGQSGGLRHGLQDPSGQQGRQGRGDRSRPAGRARRLRQGCLRRAVAGHPVRPERRQRPEWWRGQHVRGQGNARRHRRRGQVSGGQGLATTS